jgi:hypothetical protein
MMSDKSAVCTTCGNTAQWHRINNPRHRFSSVNDGLNAFAPEDSTPDGEGTGRVVPMTMPFDPVLRMALIDKGVITVADLDAADAKIKHLTGGLTNGGTETR